MKFLKYDAHKCVLCKECITKCPFQALTMEAQGIEVNGNCKMCGVCVRTCKEGAITFEQKAGSQDKAAWNDILIYGELLRDGVHPVVYELIGEGKKLAEKVNYQVKVILVGAKGCQAAAEDLLQYGVDKVYVYEHPGFDGFKADCYADAVADCIASIKPSVVLIGATPVGRSLAPRLSTRFHTGLTADCTQLDMRENTDLVQVRPAFGGNVMAQILITDARPQFATVRYKVMEPAQKVDCPTGTIEMGPVTDDMARSRITVLEQEAIHKVKSIEEEEILLAVGRGVTKDSEMEQIQHLAELLGGQICYTRPMVEKGYGDTAHQIGLSGRTVKPKLIFTFGVSGAIQFTAGMRGADCIIAINNDPDALIFQVADYGVVAEVGEILPQMIEEIKAAKER
ncbi:MAG: electron transfer flavoprotein subunit alpha [Agathobacter sp.]|nr:electron transfer flavoprotein subunit alpha [Agathobacter sp.]